MKHFKKRITAAVLLVVVMISSLPMLSGCLNNRAAAQGISNIRAAVFGDDADIDTAYEELYNGIIANIEVSKINSCDNIDEFDIVYFESKTDKFNSAKVDEYVNNGGTVVLGNVFVKEFSNDFLGAAEVVDIEGMPVDLSYPYADDEVSDISELLYDYTEVLKGYVDFGDYAGYNYGSGIIPSTAKTIVEYNGVGIYTVNRYGKGKVFITNPLLPSSNAVTKLSEGETGEPLAFSTAAAETLLRSYYAEYVSKEKYGFAVERTFGSYATKPAAWELHYEDITGIKNKSLIEFADYCVSKSQMPSFTLVRNAYTWFKRAESVTYLEYDGGFKGASYEGAYCSGNHIVSSGKWLELDSYDNTDSYFNDNPEYIKRAYPFPIDWNEDGKLDLICGSADGCIYYFEGRNMDENYEMGVGEYLTDTDGKPLSVGAYSSPTVFDIDGDGMGEIISGAEDGIIRAFHSQKDEKNPNSKAFSYMGEVINTGLGDCMVSSGFLNDDNIMDIAVGSRTGEMRVYFGYTEDGKRTLFGDYVAVETDGGWVSPCIYNHTLFSGTKDGYIITYDFDGTVYRKSGYLECDANSRRGDKRITIGMNSVPRFYDIDGDGDDDLICGSLEYGMEYPIDSKYFPYMEELKSQLEYCEKNSIYVGVHGLTHKYASPETEKKELEYHKSLFGKLGLAWDGVGANQHTWFASKYGYDGSGIEGYNPDYDGTFRAQSESGLLWNSGSTLPESDAVPQDCAENAIPMPMYLPDIDFLLLQPSNTPHGNGAYSFTSVKYEMPLLFYNHCDYMYEQKNEQRNLADKVGDITGKYKYSFVREDQLAKAVLAAYNADIKVDSADGKIMISSTVRDKNRRLYDELYSDSVGVKLVFADSQAAKEYKTDADVYKIEGNAIYIGLNKTVTLEKGEQNGLNIKEINIPADVRLKRKSATVKFKDDGMMSVRVSGDAKTKSKGWKVTKDGKDTVFVKFGKADTLKIS